MRTVSSFLHLNIKEIDQVISDCWLHVHCINIPVKVHVFSLKVSNDNFMTGDYDRQIDLIDEFIFQNVQGAPFFGTWCTIFANPGGGHRHRVTTPLIRLCKSAIICLHFTGKYSWNSEKNPIRLLIGWYRIGITFYRKFIQLG